MATNIYDYALPFVGKQILIFDTWNQSLLSTLQIDSTELLTDNPDYLLMYNNFISETNTFVLIHYKCRASL